MQSQRELSGILFKNDRKTTSKHPDYTGSATIGGEEYRLSAWIKEGRNGRFMSLSFTSPAEQRAGASATRSAPMDDQDIPF